MSFPVDSGSVLLLYDPLWLLQSLDMPMIVVKMKYQNYYKVLILPVVMLRVTLLQRIDFTSLW